MELYKTVRGESEVTQIIEKSKFIAHVRHVETREEADEFVSEIRSRYKDATHNVPAMVIGDKFQIQWASDDGEPQGTSGAPMVQMLVKEGITNIAIVVTRYFGGIKLGTGGLVRAYTGSAKAGIEAAGICSVQEICSVKIKTDYPYLAKLQNMASDKLDAELDTEKIEFVIDDIQYTDKVDMRVLCMPETEENIKKMIMNLTSGTAQILGCEGIMEKM